MGCVLSTAIASLLCHNSCSISKLVSKFAFFPPQPPSYQLRPRPPARHAAPPRHELLFREPQMQRAADALAQQNNHGTTLTADKVVTRYGQTVALLHVAHPDATHTLLWSHGNAMDIGEMYFFLVQLAVRLRVHVCAYDYSGYGASSGSPSEENCYADIAAVADHLERAHGVVPERELVLYGQSVGSAPSLWLGARRRVAGIVLHTPLLSGLRVLIPPLPDATCSVQACCSPHCIYGACDPFPNRKRISKVTCPVLLIHGTNDETIDMAHTSELFERCPVEHRRSPYIVAGAGHDNVVESDPAAFFKTVEDFLGSISVDMSALASTMGTEKPAQLAAT